MDLLTLSPSSLSLYVECPRCFWLKVNRKLDRPRGPVPTVMSGLDLVIKAYFHQFRAQGVLPPIIAGKVPGRLAPEVPTWLTLGDPSTNTKLVGKLDDLLEPEPGVVAPLDHKTRGKIAEDVHRAYQLQMDVYDLLLEVSGKKTAHKAWLVYYIPEVMEGGECRFTVDVKEVATDPERGRMVFLNAAKVARRREEPLHTTDCEYCRWVLQRGGTAGPPGQLTALADDVPF